MVAARAFHRTIARSDDHGLALLQADGVTDGLRAGLLLYQEQFASGKLLVRLAQADHNLERKKDLAVQILVEAIEIAGTVMEQQGRRPLLARRVAALEEVIQFQGIILRQSQSLHPFGGVCC
jgi:hypothetical protein